MVLGKLWARLVDFIKLYKQNPFEKFLFSLYTNTIQCVPEKRKPIKRVNLSINCNDLSEKVYIVTKIQFILFLLTPVIRCIGHA